LFFGFPWVTPHKNNILSIKRAIMMALQIEPHFSTSSRSPLKHPLNLPETWPVERENYPFSALLPTAPFQPHLIVPVGIPYPIHKMAYTSRNHPFSFEPLSLLWHSRSQTGVWERECHLLIIFKPLTYITVLKIKVFKSFLI
jgi:hypothetical protein